MVCYGLGRDSTAVLVGLWRRGQRPDLILFSDVGDEKPTTYAFLAIINVWLRMIGFPEVTVVRYQPKDYKHWPPYRTLFENCMTNITLPSMAYGFKSCSQKWKIGAMRRFLKTWAPALEAWARGGKVTKCIGFEASPHELRRTKQCETFAVKKEKGVTLRFPLQEWGWDLERCKQEIEAAGLPVPPKSSCHFCPSMKPWEVSELGAPQLCRIVIMEARTKPSLTKIEGLWRRPVKGTRGGIKKPGSMTEYIREQGLLPAVQIDNLIRLTPTVHLTQADFARDGVSNWSQWVDNIINQSRETN